MTRFEERIPPPYLRLIVIGLAVTIAAAAARGMHEFVAEYYAYGMPFKFPGRFADDPLIGTVMAHVAPIIYPLFWKIFDVPLTHLLGGLLCKSAMSATFLYFAWTLTRSSLASFFSLVLFFGLTKIEGLGGVRFPIGAMDIETWYGMYLSNRQLGTACAVAAAGLLLRGRSALAGLLLGVGMHLHPLNDMGFFLSLGLGLLMWSLAQPRPAPALRQLAIFIAAFALLALPRVLAAASMFRDVVPMPSADFWRFALRNEPSYASTLWLFGPERGLHTCKEIAIALSICALCFVPVLRRRLNPGPASEKGQGALPLLPFLMLAPLLILLLAAFWEYSLVGHMPDWINDVLIPLQIRRYGTVAVVLGSPVAALALLWSFERLWLGLRAATPRAPALPEESTLALWLSGALAAAFLVIGWSNVAAFPKYLSAEHKPYEFFIKEPVPIYDAPHSGRPAVPLSAYIETCDWVRSHTPPAAGFFCPTWIREFRTFCERPAFLTEKFDGNVAITNRRYATEYLRRFSAIHRGLTYDDMPANDVNGDEERQNEIMRGRYLSLTADDLERLKSAYPAYSYLMTEPGRALPYPVAYANAHFAVYDLTRKP